MRSARPSIEPRLNKSHFAVSFYRDWISFIRAFAAVFKHDIRILGTIAHHRSRYEKTGISLCLVSTREMK